MNRQGLPEVLRWIYFSVGIGMLMAAGIYLGVSIVGNGRSDPLRALMFFLLGTFFMLMYGENRPAPCDRKSPPTAKELESEGQ